MFLCRKIFFEGFFNTFFFLKKRKILSATPSFQCQKIKIPQLLSQGYSLAFIPSDRAVSTWLKETRLYVGNFIPFPSKPAWKGRVLPTLYSFFAFTTTVFKIHQNEGEKKCIKKKGKQFKLSTRYEI